MWNALALEQVNYNKEPHDSHVFGRKESTLVSCASNDRFGSVRTCKRCGGSEVWAGGAGSHYFDGDLASACPNVLIYGEDA